MRKLTSKPELKAAATVLTTIRYTCKTPRGYGESRSGGRESDRCLPDEQVSDLVDHFLQAHLAMRTRPSSGC